MFIHILIFYNCVIPFEAVPQILTFMDITLHSNVGLSSKKQSKKDKINSSLVVCHKFKKYTSKLCQSHSNTKKNHIPV